MNYPQDTLKTVITYGYLQWFTALLKTLFLILKFLIFKFDSTENQRTYIALRAHKRFFIFYFLEFKMFFLEDVRLALSALFIELSLNKVLYFPCHFLLVFPFKSPLGYTVDEIKVMYIKYFSCFKWIQRCFFETIPFFQIQ